MQTRLGMHFFFVHFCLGSLALLNVKLSMGLTQPT